MLEFHCTQHPKNGYSKLLLDELVDCKLEISYWGEGFKSSTYKYIY